MGSRRKYWSGLLFAPPWGLPDPRIVLKLPTLASKLFNAEPPGKPLVDGYLFQYTVNQDLISLVPCWSPSASTCQHTLGAQ